MRVLSMLSSATSLTMTAHLKGFSLSFWMCFVSRMCLRRVVLPVPRNPPSSVTGSKESESGWGWSWLCFIVLEEGDVLRLVLFRFD